MIEILRLIVSAIFAVFYRVEVVNVNNVPESGPVLICANHNGIMDMFFIGYKLKRLVHYMAKEELFKIPLLGFIIKCLGAFPVKRGKGDVSAIKTVFKLLEEGKIVGIFPEGTRTLGKRKKDIRIKPGAALIALRSGVNIVPVAVKGNYRLFSKVKVVFGKPFKIESEEGKRYRNSDLGKISEGIMNRVYSLMEE
ncbi:MAG TPA: 1-acyl-sn-glycerol-3-phosphate acyltransferase [Clostridiaceae bacterium]|nr:1-acyl-sn-glycerol-3-phosphate acyltransferase [Clostridiaceae bacterium]